MRVNTFIGYRAPRTLAAACLAAIVIGGAPRESRADVERIREKAVELDQKLNKQGFEVAARGTAPNSSRVYKDFDFILKKTKVDEVAGAESSDPRAKRLRLYLVESIVAAEIATYEDDLLKFEQTSTANVDGKDLSYGELTRRLALDGDDAVRRKLYSALAPLFETQAVYKGEILKRRNESFQPWGFQNFAEFYGAREGLDLDRIATQADELLQGTQATYDSLFAIMATRYLNTEPRKVRYYDLPYLTSGVPFEGAFPQSGRIQRVKAVFQGLGVNLPGESGLTFDGDARAGKTAVTKVFPVLVPGDVRVSVNPEGGVRDDAEALFGLGLAGIFLYSGQTAFEPAYLPNASAQAAMAYLPRFVLDEPAWIEAQATGELDKAAYQTFRLFSLLYDARNLAALARFEIDAYRGGADLEAEFRTLMETAAGARLSTSDAKRALSALHQLRSASRFEGLLLAAAMHDYLGATHGATWYQDGKVGPMLKDLWKQGGNLTVETIGAACGDAQPGTAPFIKHIDTLLAAAR
jgi:hypothetical protein